MRAIISVCYFVEVDLSGFAFPAGCTTPEQRLQHEIEKAERDPSAYSGNQPPVVNGRLIRSAPSEFSEPY